jgi:hypothetical protein
MQRPVLRRLTPQSGELMWAGWVLASTVGLAVSFILCGSAASGILGMEIPFALSWPAGVLVYVVASLVGGLLIGVLQHLMLRRHTGRSVWWIPASAVGWGLSGTGWAIAAGPDGLLPLLLAPTAAGVMLGLVTGRALYWIWR